MFVQNLIYNKEERNCIENISKKKCIDGRRHNKKEEDHEQEQEVNVQITYLIKKIAYVLN